MASPDELLEYWQNIPPLYRFLCRAPYFGMYELMKHVTTYPEVPEVEVDSIIKNSDSFPIEFPIETVRCKYLRDKGIPDAVLKKNINSVYPILHEQALVLFIDFLEYKRYGGSNVEKNFYKGYNIERLVDRLLTKRAVVFCGRDDQFMLLDGLANAGGWETIGKDDEQPPRILENCLSYEEIKLSALLSVSSYTQFTNNGSRDNCGIYSSDDVEESGIIIGLIGARFEKPDLMEYQDIMITKEQNIPSKGYGIQEVCSAPVVFINFYGQSQSTYEEVKNSFPNEIRYHKLNEDEYFNDHGYARRMAISIDTLLIEADERARESKKMAYVYVVGIGLGVWRKSSHQIGLFMDVFCKRIQFLGSVLRNTSDVCFSYIDTSSCGEYKHGDTIPILEHPNGGIKIHIVRRNPHVKLKGEDEGKLLVVSYPWDGNALPGNEFWLGHLAASGDPAAASSTQIAELHNVHINPKLSAANLKVATLRGLVPFKEYTKIARFTKCQLTDPVNKYKEDSEESDELSSSIVS